MTNKTKENDNKEEETIDLDIAWRFPDDLITRFATNIVVQTIENEFKVSFFEIKPEILLKPEDREKLQKRGTVNADCIASLIITPDRMHKFIDAMSRHLLRFEAGKGKNIILEEEIKD